MLFDTAYEIATSNIRFGPGTTGEIGMDLKDWGLKRVMVLTDPNLSAQAPVQTALAAIAEAGVEYALFDQVRVEPTDASFKAAIAYPTGPNCDRPTKAQIPSATCGRWRRCGWWRDFCPAPWPTPATTRPVAR